MPSVIYKIYLIYFHLLCIAINYEKHIIFQMLQIRKSKLRVVMLWAELCSFQIHVEVLNLSPSECDHTHRLALQRGKVRSLGGF